MTTAYTCPHCETALRLPAHASEQRVLCPRCGATVSHRDASIPCREDQRPIYATALDSIAWDQFATHYLGGGMEMLTHLGGIISCFFAIGVVSSGIGHLIHKHLAVFICISSATVAATLPGFGIQLARRARRNSTRIIGWLIVGHCALVSTGAIVGFFGVVAFALAREFFR